MLLQMLLLLASIVGFIIFMWVIIRKFGLISSISYSHWLFKSPWTFSIFTWICSFPIIIMGILSSSLLLALSGIFWAFVGCAPGAKDYDMEDSVHVAGAFGAILFGYAYILSLGYWWIVIPATIFIGIIWWRKIQNHTFWIEFTAFITNGLGLFLYLVS